MGSTKEEKQRSRMEFYDNQMDCEELNEFLDTEKIYYSGDEKQIEAEDSLSRAIYFRIPAKRFAKVKEFNDRSIVESNASSVKYFTPNKIREGNFYLFQKFPISKS
jgi:hypothetical protein